jgi:3'-5' exonuclease
MLDHINIENILFLDIETVPQYPVYGDLPGADRKLWDLKVQALQKSGRTAETPEAYYRSAGIYAEFGKIICISAGFVRGKEFRAKSFYGDDEIRLLAEFSALLNQHYSKNESQLCGHNGKEFDFPFIARRMLILGMPIPRILDTSGKKPWEVQHLDTMELWKFGDYKSYTSLNLLAHVLGVPTPKDDIDGSMVYQVYYEEKNLERIVTYCQKDVLTVAQIFLRMKGEALIVPEAVKLPEIAHS